MDTKQPEALRLAEMLERPGYGWNSTIEQYAAELRRQHAEIETLRAGYDAARLEIESLQTRIQELGQQARECSDRKVVQLESALAIHVRSGKDWAMRVEALERTITTLRAHIASLNAQVAAVGAGGVEPLRKRDCLHQIQEPDHFRGATKMVDDDSAVMSISLRQRADAWMRVCALLHELRPGWIDTGTGTAAQQALDAIRSMAAQK